jgi:hypothetical protein
MRTGLKCHRDLRLLRVQDSDVRRAVRNFDYKSKLRDWMLTRFTMAGRDLQPHSTLVGEFKMVLSDELTEFFKQLKDLKVAPKQRGIREAYILCEQEPTTTASEVELQQRKVELNFAKLANPVAHVISDIELPLEIGTLTSTAEKLGNIGGEWSPVAARALSHEGELMTRSQKVIKVEIPTKVDWRQGLEMYRGGIANKAAVPDTLTTRDFTGLVVSSDPIMFQIIRTAVNITEIFGEPVSATLLRVLIPQTSMVVHNQVKDGSSDVSLHNTTVWSSDPDEIGFFNDICRLNLGSQVLSYKKTAPEVKFVSKKTDPMKFLVSELNEFTTYDSSHSVFKYLFAAATLRNEAVDTRIQCYGAHKTYVEHLDVVSKDIFTQISLSFNETAIINSLKFMAGEDVTNLPRSTFDPVLRSIKENIDKASSLIEVAILLYGIAEQAGKKSSFEVNVSMTS